MNFYFPPSVYLDAQSASKGFGRTNIALFEKVSKRLMIKRWFYNETIYGFIHEDPC